MKSIWIVVFCLCIAACTIERPYPHFERNVSDYAAYPSRGDIVYGTYDPYPSYKNYNGFRQSNYWRKSRFMDTAEIAVEKWDISQQETNVVAKVNGKEVHKVGFYEVYPKGRLVKLGTIDCQDGQQISLNSDYNQKAKYLKIRVYDRLGNVLAEQKKPL